MAYYTGQCSSYQHLADILVEKCQQHGWTWQDNILNKNGMYIHIQVNQKQPTVYYHDGIGIILTGATGKQGSTLINPGATKVRLGSTSYAVVNVSVFPAIYHLFIFEHEVYLLMKFDTNKFYYLMFGQSLLLQNTNTQANSLFLSATACLYGYDNRSPEYIFITPTSGGASGTRNKSAVAPFWNRNDFSDNWSNSVICHGIDNTLWSSGKSRAYAIFEPLINRLPTTHFSDSPLLPYNIYLQRPQNKLSLIAQLENARFVCIDNYEPEQVIILGHEKWIVFPFFQKNTQQRDAGSSTEIHTGTFGWAIRYEG